MPATIRCRKVGPWLSTLAVACLATSAARGEDPPKDKAQAAADKVSYYKQVRPIFQAHCQGCHQPAKAGGGVLSVPPVISSGRRAPIFGRFRKGDGAGFDAVVLVHLDAAYSLARYLARDGETAEDIVQTAVLKSIWGRGARGGRGRGGLHNHFWHG